MLNEERDREDREEMFQIYVGQVVWQILTIQQFKVEKPKPFPQYAVLARDRYKGPQKEPTANEIKDHILEKLEKLG